MNKDKEIKKEKEKNKKEECLLCSISDKTIEMLEKRANENYKEKK
ncbi:MAG: hypothetical protein PHH17_00455 [Candidatus Pacebacteria bacterium]|jgi:hypothetical protein|nr:hypothetical protein [Candidatus Paceibacterota bacterium]MDD3072170.1 hypothetical protein [Candidatus Paceibacterota bacterium]MDD4201376.1 hypothetical protein [Candidatus Paceibacterota bacterium]MDD4466934.1 hypothetical protein [Candidatus Paceibacterota bacterium]MDD4897509.1 hypothetical protein [Candidatus Paceibacterota bacterium]